MAKEQYPHWKVYAQVGGTLKRVATKSFSKLLDAELAASNAYLVYQGRYDIVILKFHSQYKSSIVQYFSGNEALKPYYKVSRWIEGKTGNNKEVEYDTEYPTLEEARHSIEKNEEYGPTIGEIFYTYYEVKEGKKKVVHKDLYENGIFKCGVAF